MKIAHRTIGHDHPPLVVAEIGISHMGSAGRCREIMRACHANGIEAVKLQTHIAEAEMVPDHPWFDTVKRCELSEVEETEAFRFAESLGLICFSTPFSLEAVARLERIGTPAYKIGSGEASWAPLLEAVGQTGKPSMYSLGMDNADLSIRATLNHVCGEKDRAVPMHCVSEYPTPPGRWDLGVLWREHWNTGESGNQLQHNESDLFGYSDHTTEPAAVHAAVAHGACVVECHVGMHDYEWTTNHTPDHLVEWSPEDLGKLARDAANIWRGMKPVTNRGAEVAKLCRRDEHGRRMAG